MEKMAHFFPFKTTKVRWLNFSTFSIIGILIVAAFLRLYKIGDYMTFLGDEGRDALVVYNILHGKLTLLGPTSSVGGFFLGPIYYYFMAPFLWLFQYDPVGPAVMVGLVGTATVFLVYKIGSEFFNKTAGIIAALLYAISPLVIAYSRSSWNPNLMPTFSLLTLYVLYRSIVSKNTWLMIVSGILFGITMQLHYVATFLGLIIIVYVITLRLFFERGKFFGKIMQIIKDGMSLLIGFLIGWSPFLAFEFRHGFLNLQSIAKFILNSEDTGGGGHFASTVSNVLYRVFARLITKYPPPEQVSIKADTDIAVWYYLTVGLIIISLGYFVVRVYKTSVTKDHSFYRLYLLLVWFVIGVCLFGFYKKPIYDYYFQFMYPVPFLFVGAVLSWLLTRTLISKVIALVIIGALVWINLTGIPFRYQPNRQKDQVKTIAEFVLSKTDNKPFNFALLTLGNSDHGYRYFFKLAEKDPIVIQTPQLDPDRKTVTDQLLIVCEDPNCQPLGASIWEVAGFGRAEIVDKWDVSVVKVYKLVHYSGEE